MTGLSNKTNALINGGTSKQYHCYNQDIILTGDSYSHLGRNPLTICIAAIGQERGQECIVFATDHMVTIDIGLGREQILGKFEHDIKKYKHIPPNTVAMLAGKMDIFGILTEIPSYMEDYDKIKIQIFENFKKYRDEVIKNEVLDAFNLDKESLKLIMESNTTNPMNSITEAIVDSINKYYTNTRILLIGFDQKNQAKITEIDEYATIDKTSIQFGTIGSGYLQATNTLFFQKHTKQNSLKETIYNVFKAKSNAEVHEGVGKETELLILKKDGCYKTSTNMMKILGRVYQDELKYSKKDKRLKTLNLEKECKLC
ncbi:MAG: hypothetical protein ABSG49_11005 [Methanoregula sp.]|jgi:hypothetical protein|uniref:hypothetical protein n=1 Tax=Methanoregula sp. TaxID=2052170 RepID=UPI003C164FF3